MNTFILLLLGFPPIAVPQTTVIPIPKYAKGFQTELKRVNYIYYGYDLRLLLDGNNGNKNHPARIFLHEVEQS